MKYSEKILELENVIQDLNTIFHQAMANKELAVALKTRELLIKILDAKKLKKHHVKPLLEWTDEEIRSFISDAELLHCRSKC
ncbi:hypothetical protein P618_200127 [Holospora obtusa F1]|uniref:Uncharacterized protein n=1 Tax=Holospora obtusa F1 TaxID=1399147 RepID=W6TEH4_HOLOB|nr:hypothetical protein [Holospora obtusa]ETZ07658.1 hypothetical protein P618_200127 [Holospora obtusa F1]